MFRFKNKNFKIVCLMLAVVMMALMATPALAVEEIDDIAVAEIAMCEHIQSDDGIGIEPMSIFCGSGHSWGSEYKTGGHTNDYYCWIVYIYQDCTRLFCGASRYVRTQTDSHTWVLSGGRYTCRTCSHPYPW